MSHVLHFFTKEEGSFDPQGLASWAESQSHLTAAPAAAGLQLAYRNEHTGVYFAIDYAPNGRIKKLEARLNECFDTGLTFRLDYVVPTFFARETMAVAADLAERFDLLVFDPQQDNAKPGPCRADELVESWCRKNEWSVHAMAAQGLMDDLFYMPRDKADALWDYSLHKAAYQSRLGETVFVPKILVFVPKGRRECVTAIIWNSAHPMVFPAIDHVILIKRKARPLGAKDEESFEHASASEVRDAIVEGLVPFDGSDSVSLLTPDQAARHAGAFQKIATQPLDDAFTGIDRDRFVDVEFLSEGPA